MKRTGPGGDIWRKRLCEFSKWEKVFELKTSNTIDLCSDDHSEYDKNTVIVKQEIHVW